MRWPRPLPFTRAQYEELEQQALIYKYLVAGVPVPPDLVVPIRRGLDSLATRFYGHPTRTFPSPSSSSSSRRHPCRIAFGVLLASSSGGVPYAELFVYSDQVYFSAGC